MKLQDIMIREVIQVRPDESIAEAAKRMRGQFVAPCDAEPDASDLMDVGG